MPPANNSTTQPLNNWRNERKFRLPNISRSLALQIVRLHPAGFKTVFPQRWINNIYFDDLSLTALNENFAGIADRQKIRLRWYGETFPKVQRAARVEWKTRSNQLGKKRVKKLPAFPFCGMEEISPVVQQVWPELDTHRPVLLNRYLRFYFGVAGSRIRLTVDWELAVAEPHSALQTRHLHYQIPGGVLEIKYPAEEEDYARWVMQYLPFRVSKHSKYVSGLFALYG